MIIPDKNLFIVTSSLKPAIGAFSDEDRFAQTIASVKSIRKVVPDAIIMFADISIRGVSELEKQAIAEWCNYYLDLTDEPNTRYCAINGLKSHGENCLLAAVLVNLKNNPQLSHILGGVKRIFKISARTILEDSFNINEYEGLFGKFVFKKRVVSWSDPKTCLFITRMYSFCPSLIDTYLGVIQKNLDGLSNNIVPDTEHAHFLNIPQNYLVEFDTLHCWGWLSGNGQIEKY